MMKQSDFQRLVPAHRELFRDFMRRFPTVSCERAWANLRLYRDSYDWHFAILDDHLVMVSFRSGHVQYPVGTELAPPELAALLRRVAAAGGWAPGCYDVPMDYPKRHENCAAFFMLKEDPGEADYLYDLSHLAALSGSRLRKKHNQIRQFERDFAGRFQVLPLRRDNLAPVLELARELNRRQEDSGSIAEENLALDRLEAEFDDPDLELRGIVLEVDQAVAGFSIYSPLGETAADIHFEKASREFRNSATMLTFALVETLLKQGFTTMNREQDLGDGGLRQAKHSWDPSELYCRGTLAVRPATV